MDSQALTDWFDSFPITAFSPVNGAQGSSGPIGPTGPQGSIGFQGFQGKAGATGKQGPAGKTGAQGAQGAQGSIGTTGAIPSDIYSKLDLLKNSIEGLKLELNLALEKLNTGYISVSTAQDFLNAINNKEKCILLTKDIFVPSSITILSPISIISVSGSTISYDTQTTSYLFDIQQSFDLYGVKFVGSNKDFGRCFNIGGNRFNGKVKITKCHFESMGNVLSLSGGVLSNLAPDIDFSFNIIRNCCSKNYLTIGKFGVIELNRNFRTVKINYNEIYNVWSNGIWIGNSEVGGGQIIGNIIENSERIGIENFGANRFLILQNHISGGNGLYEGGGMGISCAGDFNEVCKNIITNVFSYGIEVYKNNNLVEGNIIDGLTMDVAGKIALGISIDHCYNSVIRGNYIKNIKYGKLSPRFAMEINNNSSENTIDSNECFDVTEGIRLLSGEDNFLKNNRFTLSWDEGTLAASCQPAILVFGGERNFVVQNVARMKKAGNTNGAFWLGAGAKVFADFSGKQIVAPAGGTSFGSRLGQPLQNTTNLCLN